MAEKTSECGHVRLKDGVVCARKNGHPGAHLDKGEDIGEGFQGVRAMKYQTWEPEDDERETDRIDAS